jgi:hypothetical protein
VTIVVEDRAGRSAEAFGEELVQLRTKLECAVEERDRLWRFLGTTYSEGISRVAEFLKHPRQETRQEIHVHRQSRLVTIGGPTMSQGGIDLPKLAEELGRLRDAMTGEATGAREQDKAIGAVDKAKKAAARGDGPAALRYLKSAGRKTLEFAEKIAVPVATEALKKVLEKAM